MIENTALHPVLIERHKNFVASVGRDLLPADIATTGSGPCEEIELDDLRRELDVTPRPVGDADDVKWVVVGRDGWDEEDIHKHLEGRCGDEVHFYSHEMLEAWIVGFITMYENGQPTAAALALAEGHPLFEWLDDEGFDWTTTTVVPSTFDGSADFDLHDIGMLRHLGYRVGKSGRPGATRRRILTDLFYDEELPLVQSEAYVESFGEPRSGQRLKKLATTIASFARTAKRRTSPPEQAIEDWESDLDWLRKHFYRGAHRFRWPSTKVSG